jgi:hypothetical protein
VNCGAVFGDDVELVRRHTSPLDSEKEAAR